MTRISHMSGIETNILKEGWKENYFLFYGELCGLLLITYKENEILIE